MGIKLDILCEKIKVLIQRYVDEGGESEPPPTPETPPPADTSPPIITLSASKLYFNAVGDVTLEALASDNIAVAELWLEKNNVFLQSLPATGATLTLPLGMADNGEVVFKLTGKDAAQNTTIETVKIVVDLPPVVPPPTEQPPTLVSLTASKYTVDVAGRVAVNAVATDPKKVTKVIFYRNGGSPYQENAAPYDYNPQFSAADNGTTTIKAVAYNAAGLTDEKEITLTINIPAEPPAPPPAPTLLVDPLTAVTGATITATMGSLQAGDQIDWGDGTVETAAASKTHVYANSGPYTVKVLRGGVPQVGQGVVISTPVIGITYDPPIVITQGGTYSGNWQSVDDRNIPAVEINTSQPVTLHASHIRGKGDLVRSRKGGARLTLRDIKGEGVNPNVAGKPQGRFMDLQYAAALLIEHNEFDGTGGIYINGYNGNGVGDTFIVRYNFGRNINGRYSDGNGGYMTGQNDFHRKQLVQFNHVKNIPGARIEWNRALNEPRISHVEDNINIFDSWGKSDSDRILVRRNLIQGGYGWNPASEYSGSGIALLDGGGKWVTAEYNTILETSNAGIFISDGNDASILNNTILGRGILADGTLLDLGSDAGIYSRDYSPLDDVRRPESVLIFGNTVGWGTPTASNPNGRWDISIQTINGMPSATTGNNTLMPPGPITQAMLDAARDAFFADMASAGVTIGRLT